MEGGGPAEEGGWELCSYNMTLAGCYAGNKG